MFSFEESGRDCGHLTMLILSCAQVELGIYTAIFDDPVTDTHKCKLSTAIIFLETATSEERGRDDGHLATLEYYSLDAALALTVSLEKLIGLHSGFSQYPTYNKSTLLR
jgi:hypothetical protein